DTALRAMRPQGGEVRRAAADREMYETHFRVLVGLETYRTAKMRFVHFPVRCSSLKLHPLGAQRASNAPLRQREDPRKTDVHQQRRFLVMRQKPDELDSGFIPSLDDADRLWAGALFVPRNPRDSVPERPRGDGGDLHRVVSLQALLCTQPQAKT